MDWTTLLVTILSSAVGSGTIAGTVAAMIFRKQNKELKNQEVFNSQLDNKIKELEVESQKIDNDTKQIDLGDLYLRKVQEMSDMLSDKLHEMMSSNDKYRADSEKRLNKRIDELSKKIDRCVIEISAVEECLNGNWVKYKNDHPELDNLGEYDRIRKTTNKGKASKSGVVKTVKTENQE